MSASAHFHLRQSGIELAESTAAKAEFAATRTIICHDALDAALVARLDRICDAAEFRSDHVEHLGHRRIEKPAIAGGAIALLLQREPLYRWLEEVTGCATIVRAEGRVVQTYAEPGDQLVWHNDTGSERVLAVTIALSSPDYDGGLFELRAAGGDTPLLTYKHDRPGTALIFEVDRRSEHRVLPLVAGGPRRVFTGWFFAA